MIKRILLSPIILLAVIMYIAAIAIVLPIAIAIYLVKWAIKGDEEGFECPYEKESDDCKGL